MRQAGFCLALSLAVAFALPASAQTTAAGSAPPSQPSSPSATQPATASTQQPQTVSPKASPVAQHVTLMTPEHAILHGALFGECISELAITGECPHHDQDE